MGFAALPNTFTLGDRNWSVETGPASTHHAKRTVYAPTDLSQSGRFQRAHSNASVRHGHADIDSFCEATGIHPDVANAVDYARISSLLRQASSIAHEGSYDESTDSFEGGTTMLSRATDWDPPRRLPDGALSFYENTDDILAAFDLLTRACHGGHLADWQEYYHWAASKVDTSAPDAPRRRLFKQAIRDATAAVRTIISPYAEEPTDDSLDETTYAERTEQAAAEAWRILNAYLSRTNDGELVTGNDPMLASDEWDDLDNEDDWCTMQIVRPVLKLPHSPRLRRRAWRMSDEGALLRSPHRACTDGRVFGSIRRKRDSGSVIIDTSGSMHLTADDIDDVMTLLPGVTVATYCSDTTYDGELRIVAAKGRRASPDDLTKDDWVGNGVDGPALRWLARQPAPRYWICDGVVTGIHDSTNLKLREECQRLARRYDITRIGSLFELRQHLGIAD